MLHIVNGESGVAALRRADIPGDGLGWDDPLHEGPVPAGLDMAGLSAVRARFVAEHFDLDHEETRGQFERRDSRLQQAVDAGVAIVLWNTPELYDQLHLLQLLDWFGKFCQADITPDLAFCRELLGCADEETLRRAFEARQPVSAAQLNAGQCGWRAFRHSDPSALATLARRDDAPLPYLAAGLERLCAEFPDQASGLSLTERRILKALSADSHSPGPLFRAMQAEEDPPFMGDWSFWRVVEKLTLGPAPLIATADGAPFRRPPRDPVDDRFLGQRLKLTECGRRVLAGKGDRMSSGGGARWIGGVQLDPDCVWRWDAATGDFKAPA